MTTSTLVYSSATGYVAPEFAPQIEEYVREDFCFICSRCTNHVGEHDAHVAAGMAIYREGDVIKTSLWEPTKASQIAEAGFTAYMAGPEAYEAFCAALEAARAS